MSSCHHVRGLLDRVAERLIYGGLIALVALWTRPALAVPGPLPPGATLYNQVLNPVVFSPNYITGPLPAAFHVLVASQNFPYNYNGTLNNSFSGFVQSKVWANDAGALAFTYIFNNLQPPGNENPPLTDIVRATINDPSNPWTGVTISSAGADASGHTTPIAGAFGSWSDGQPFNLARSATDSGIAVNFNPLNSGTQLNSTPNDQSALVWVVTNAAHFAITNVGFSDNGHVGTANAYAPEAGGPFIPEPSTIVLAALGAAGGLLAIRRRSR
jgi:PEP-CTERM motif